MKKLILILAIAFCGLCFFTEEVSAQQDAQFTQHMFNPITYNPAYAGSRGVISIAGIARRQWMGIEGTPKSGNFGIHGPLRDSNSALGLWAEFDEVGFRNTTRIFGTYAYHIPMNNGSKLSIGIQGGGRMFKFATDGAGDGDVLANDLSKFIPNFGAGLYLYSKMYFVGLSAPRLIGEDLLEESSALTELNELENHYYLTAGVVIPLTESLKFKPTALLRYVKDAPLALDLTGHFLIKDMLWLGAAWRAGDSVDFLAEVQATPQIRVGYAYDYTLSDLSTHKPHTHEVMLGYDFCYKRSNVVTPRYF